MRLSAKHGRVLLVATVLSALLAWATGAPAEPGGQAQAPQPRLRYRTVTPDYFGPGRHEPEPADVVEVLLAWFGPSDPADPETGPIWQAACLAIEQANAEGGYQGKRFRLLPCWSENPWGTGVSRLARAAYDSDVWAVVGSVRGDGTHLAEQVVTKARLPLVGPVDTDKTVNLVNVAWMFSLAPGDHLQAPVLAEAVLAEAAGKPFVMLSSTDHDSRLTAAELLAQFSRRGVLPAMHLSFSPVKSGERAADLSLQLERISSVEAGAVVVIAGPGDSARAVRAIRAGGLSAPIFGGAAMGRSFFLQQAGSAAEGVVFPLLFDSEASEKGRAFTRLFEEKAGGRPDYAVAYTYDAVGILVAAVRKAGLNRARIRDQLRRLSPWDGVTGRIRWDPTGQNEQPVTLGTIAHGRIVKFERAPGAPRAHAR